MTLFADLWGILTPKQRRGILTMQIVSTAMAFSTVSGIAAIAPFFAVLGQPELIDHNALSTGRMRTAASQADAASSWLSA
jgi:hypothetical protein